MVVCSNPGEEDKKIKMANVVTETFKITVSRTLQYFYRYIDAARAFQQF